MAENKSNPGVAAVLSFVFNGLGQIYNGEIRKGLLIIFLSSLSLLMIVCGGILAIIWLWKGMLISAALVTSLIIFGLGVVTAVFIGIFSIFDAYKTAKKLD